MRLFAAILLLGILFALTGCEHNLFAPQRGDEQSGLWNEQASVGGLLANFTNSYLYRDSSRYADCISESFLFTYYDPDRGRYDQWYRITDLTATGALFRTYDDIRLTFGTLSSEVSSLNQSDTLISFQVSFNLELGDQLPIFGYARFETRKETDGKFRFVSWRDDF
ncbi:MAG: hypothetical protein OEM52_06525 [bacterium]|nr:hypothetical protein [bacterium]